MTEPGAPLHEDGTSRGVMLVTGGGRGIGAATARLAASLGYSVCLTYLDDEASATDVRTQLESGGARAMAVRADVSVESDVSRVFAAIDAAWGPVTALVNNAGILFQQCRADEVDPDRLRRLFDVNVVGAFLVAKQAVLRMSTAHGGSGGTIVNVSSRAAVLGSPHEYVDYAASKGAVDTLTIGLSKEVAREGIRVNGVRPGIITTGIHASGGDPRRPGRLAETIPMGRPGEPDEVAEAILWLSSEQSAFVTGTFIDVSGGR
jgi:NAD(P)-dependent dehydrogenase (short-subunit alcohol dehydrogenase family)